MSIFFIPKVLIATDIVEPKQNMHSLISPVVAIELFVNEPWLSSIRDGKKTVEGRTGPLKEFSEWIGKKAKFYSKEQELIVDVIEVHHYDTLEAYLFAEGWKNAAPHLNSFEDTVNAYLQFYPGNYVRDNGGMNAIIVSVQR